MGSGSRKVIALAATVALVLLPATALAKKKHKKPKGLGPVVTVTAAGNTATTSGDFSVADATCPAGLQAVGGGFSAPFNNTTAAFVVTESYRSAPNTWRVRALDGDGVGAATSYAYCRRNNKVITDMTGSATTTNGFGENAKAQAVCPPGLAAISGGFQITSGPGATTAVPTESIGGGPTPGGTPSDGFWNVTAQNIATSETITAHVYCMAGIKLPAFQQVQTSAVVGPFGPVIASASCPPAPKVKAKKKGKKKKKKKPAQLLSAGAFYSPFTPGSSEVFPIHVEARIDGNAFIDHAIANGTGGTLTVQSQAMCF